jgi:hypothetical protein
VSKDVSPSVQNTENTGSCQKNVTTADPRTFSMSISFDEEDDQASFPELVLTATSNNFLSQHLKLLNLFH